MHYFIFLLAQFFFKIAGQFPAIHVHHHPSKSPLWYYPKVGSVTMCVFFFFRKK